MPGQGGIHITVTGFDYYVERFKRMPWLIDSIFSRASYEIRNAMMFEISNVFQEAAASAGEGFPAIYTEQLLNIVATKDVSIETGGGQFSVFFDFDSLGSYEDLAEGFHYHARTDDGGMVELPYVGQALRNDLETRYTFWLSIAETMGGKIPVASLVTETYAARTAYWDLKGVAPQWLLLNYGQGEFYPYISPFPIIETVRARIASVAYDFVHRELQDELNAMWEENYIPDPVPVRTITPYPHRPGLAYIRSGSKGHLAGSMRI